MTTRRAHRPSSTPIQEEEFTLDCQHTTKFTEVKPKGRQEELVWLANEIAGDLAERLERDGGYLTTYTRFTNRIRVAVPNFGIYVITVRLEEEL